MGVLPPHLYSPGHAFHGMGSEDGLERLDQVRHLATPALVKTSPAGAVLAHQDGLTGLENRLSFNEFEEELKRKKEGCCIIVQLDINDLKKMNDNYGHVEGDRGIRAAAAVISESFEDPSRVFRTGGDEFIAVMKGTDKKRLLKDYERNEKKLQQAIEAYNKNEQPPVPLSIAYGMAECDCTSDDPEEKEKLADERMYEHKKMLKKGRAQA